MSWDIYGNPLARGHCEVHPHVHEEYPCSVCMAEKQQRQQRDQQSEAEYYMQMEIDNLKRDIAEYKKESSDKTGEILKMKDVLWGVLAMIDESWGASSDAGIALVDDIKALLKGGE